MTAALWNKVIHYVTHLNMVTSFLYILFLRKENTVAEQSFKSVSRLTNIYNGVAYMWIDLTVCMEIAGICNKH